MPCLVKYCNGEETPTLGLCASHLKRWHKAGEPVGDALDAWVKSEIDVELDVCPTPLPLALEICRRLEAEVVRDHYMCSPFRILEPSAGDGPFVKACRSTWPESDIVAVEIRVEVRSALEAAGADVVLSDDIAVLAEEFDYLGNADLVVGNPPFNQAEEHIRELLGNMKDGAHLAFLLRIGFYESIERLPFWKDHPEKFFAPIVPRPGFKVNKHGKDGTDSQAYGLFVWQKGWAGTSTRLPHLVWSKEKKRGGRGKKEEAKVEDQIVTPDLNAVEAPELE